MPSLIYYPAGIPLAQSFFGPVARAAGLGLEAYSPELIKNWNAGDRSGIQALFERKPALFITPTNIKIGRELLEAGGDRVKLFASVSTGTDHVDLGALAGAGKEFIHAPGVNARSVVEYVLSALGVLHQSEELLSGDKSVGIIGYGRIGSQLGKYLGQLGIPHRWYDPLIKPGPASLPDVLKSDIISFHVPLTREGEHATLGMANQELLSQLSPDALLINTSRGKIFSPDDFTFALGRFRTVMDVFPEEPPPAPDLEGPRLVTPHIAGYNYEARVGGARTVALQFAERLNLSPEIVPPIPEPEFDHNVLDFLESESTALKNDPASFGQRRSKYPARAGIGDAPVACSSGKFSPYQERLIQLFRAGVKTT